MADTHDTHDENEPQRSAFDLEPEGEARDEHAQGGSGSEPPRKPLDLEEPVAEVPVDDVEHCPNCGAPMPEADALVCLQCGYDLKQLRITRTNVGVEETDNAADDVHSKPLTRPGRGNQWAGLVLAGVSGMVLLIGYLAGAEGLFPEIAAAADGAVEVPWAARGIAVIQFIVLMALLCACGIAGLVLLGQMLQRPIGDLALAATRILGIVITIRLLTFLEVPGPRSLEWVVEGVLQAAAFVGLVIVLFALKPRNAMILGAFALSAFVALWVLARVTLWSIEGTLPTAATALLHG